MPDTPSSGQPAPAVSPAGRAVDHLGFWTAVSLVMGNMIGSGVFLLPAALAPYGGLSLAGWSISTVGSLLVALVFAALAREVTAIGGPYAYTRQAFGDFAGFLMAWGYWISIWCTNGAIAVALVGYLGTLVPALTASPAAAAISALAVVWLLTGVNAWRVRAAGHVQLWTTLLKAGALVAIGVAGVGQITPAALEIPAEVAAAPFPAVTATATLTLWAFLGLESATIPADHIADARRAIPRATIVGTLLTAVIYITATMGVMAIVPPSELANETAPFAEAARRLWGGWAQTAMALGAVVSCFGALNGWILLQGQIARAAAVDGLFPAAFARLSGRGTPVFGLVLSSVLSTALVAMNYTRGLVDLFTFVILLATLTAVVPYAFSTMARLKRLLGRPDGSGGRGALVIAALAFVYSFWAIAGAGQETVYWGFLLLLAGLPVHVWLSRRPAPSAS